MKKLYINIACAVERQDKSTQYNNASTPNTPTGFVYDYFIKDHLGNIRMVLTDEYKQDIYPAATLEGDISTDGVPNAVYKEKDYYTINSAYIVDKSTATGITDYLNHNGNPPANNNPYSNTTANSAKLYKLNSGTNKTGLGITLKVMAGDRIDIFGKSYYFTSNTGGTGANSAIPALQVLTGLLGGPTGGTAASAHGGVTASQLNGIGDVTSGVTTLLGSQTTDAAGAPAVPKAYINYIFFDEQFKVAASGFSKVGSNSVVKTHTDLTNKTAPKNGYVYIYVSNQSQVDVFFDNLQVIHTRGAILEETHYYPYGMKMAGISSKAFDALKNPYQYQGDYSEFNDETGWNEFYLRSYDAQTGRFVQIDPYNEFPSPYTGMGNNPVSNADPDGGCIFCETAAKALTLSEVVISVPAKAGNAFQSLLGVASTVGSSIAAKEAYTKVQPFSWPITSPETYNNWVNNQALIRDRKNGGGPLIREGDPESYINEFDYYARSWESEQQWRQMNYNLLEFGSIWLPVPKVSLLRTISPALKADMTVLRLGARSPKLIGAEVNFAAKGGGRFIVTEGGTAVIEDANLLAKSLDGAGIPKFSTQGAGVGYNLPNGVQARIMQPSGSNPLRVSFGNGSARVTAEGLVPQKPFGMSLAQWKIRLNQLTHVNLK
ncbi:MAG: RHS repeat-associated core domain-containing protein [Agriterribacter sp.]